MIIVISGIEVGVRWPLKQVPLYKCMNNTQFSSPLYQDPVNTHNWAFLATLSQHTSQKDESEDIMGTCGYTWSWPLLSLRTPQLLVHWCHWHSKHVMCMSIIIIIVPCSTSTTTTTTSTPNPNDDYPLNDDIGSLFTSVFPWERRTKSSSTTLLSSS